MLIRGGENIYCTEIEDRLTAHADVVEAAVFGIPERVLGEVVGAAVFLRPVSAADFRKLADNVGAALTADTLPVEIAIHPAPLPRHPTGKLPTLPLRSTRLAGKRTAPVQT